MINHDTGIQRRVQDKLDKKKAGDDHWGGHFRPFQQISDAGLLTRWEGKMSSLKNDNTRKDHVATKLPAHQ